MSNCKAVRKVLRLEHELSPITPPEDLGLWGREAQPLWPGGRAEMLLSVSLNEPIEVDWQPGNGYKRSTKRSTSAP